MIPCRDRVENNECIEKNDIYRAQRKQTTTDCEGVILLLKFLSYHSWLNVYSISVHSYSAGKLKRKHFAPCKRNHVNITFARKIFLPVMVFWYWKLGLGHETLQCADGRQVIIGFILFIAYGYAWLNCNRHVLHSVSSGEIVSVMLFQFIALLDLTK